MRLLAALLAAQAAGGGLFIVHLGMVIDDGADDEVGFSSAHGWNCVLARAQRFVHAIVHAISRHTDSSTRSADTSSSKP